MKQIFIALLFALSACAPKAADNANNSASNTATAASSAAPNANSAPSAVAAAKANSVGIALLNAGKLAYSESGNDWYDYSIAFVESTTPATNSAELLQKLNAAIAKDYTGEDTQGTKDAVLAALKKQKKQHEDDNAPLHLANTTVLFNGKGFLSLELRRLKDMDPRDFYTYDLHTGTSFSIKDALNSSAALQYIEANHKFYKDNAAYWKRRNEVSVELKDAWLTDKGIALYFFIHISPDEEDVCAGDECWQAQTVPFAQAASIIASGSPLLRITQ